MEQQASLRDALTQRMKSALKASDKRTLSTTRLILAAIKDRDIEARAKGKDGISEDDILRLLSTMTKQRKESIASYEQAGRVEMVEQEREEIDIIASFMPKQLSPEELEASIKELIKSLEVTSLKDMGRVMNELKSRYPGRMDPSKAIALVRNLLQ